MERIPKKILLPHLDSHGDLVLFSGFAVALAEKYPQATLTVLVRKGYDQIAELLPAGICWLTTSAMPYGPYRREDEPEIKRLITLLRGGGFDLLLNTVYDRTWLDELLAGALSGTERIAIGTPRHIPARVMKLAGDLGINLANPYSRVLAVAQWDHETVKYQQIWDELFPDDRRDIALPRLDVPRELEKRAQQELHRSGLTGKGFIACVPGGVQNVTIKCWPVGRYTEVLGRVFRTLGLPPLLVGHIAEAPILNRLAARLQKQSIPCRIWLGRDGDFALMAAILQQAVLYLGNDTGPLHVAGAVGTPVVGIYGGGHWPRFTPANAPSIALAGEMDCFGCLWNCPFTDGKCVTLIKVDDVMSAVTSLLDTTVLDRRIIRAGSSRAPYWLELLRRNLVVRLFKGALRRLSGGER